MGYFQVMRCPGQGKIYDRYVLSLQQFNSCFTHVLAVVAHRWGLPAKGRTSPLLSHAIRDLFRRPARHATVIRRYCTSSMLRVRGDFTSVVKHTPPNSGVLTGLGTGVHPAFISKLMFLPFVAYASDQRRARHSSLTKRPSRDEIAESSHSSVE